MPRGRPKPADWARSVVEGVGGQQDADFSLTVTGSRARDPIAWARVSTPIIIDHVAFDAPGGLDDVTRYVFGDDVLEVELQMPSNGATPAAEVAADLRESIMAVFPSGQILDEGETMLDGRRARFVAYEVGAPPEQVVGMAVVANLSGGGFAKLVLHAADRAELGPRFGPTLASVSLRGGEAPTRAGPGFRRERVGPIALDVPDELLGPRERLYADADDRLRLRISVRPVGAPVVTLEQAIARDAKRGTLLERDDRAWSWGWWARYRQRSANPPHRERAIVRAGLTVRAPDAADQHQHQPPAQIEPRVRQVEIHGTAEPSRAPTLYGAFDALLASVRWHEGQGSAGGEGR